MSTTTLGVKLEKSVRDRLKSLGKSKDRTPHWLVRKAIDEYLAREEQWEKEKREDLAAWEEYQLTGEAFTSDQVIGWMKQLRRGKRREWPR